MKKLKKVILVVLGIIYMPIYLIAWLLHIIARAQLAIAYFGLLEFYRGKSVFKSIFEWHGKY